MIDASHCKVHLHLHLHAAGARGGNQGMSCAKGDSTPRYIWPGMRMVCRPESLLLRLPGRIAPSSWTHCQHPGTVPDRRQGLRSDTIVEQTRSRGMRAVSCYEKIVRRDVNMTNTCTSNTTLSRTHFLRSTVAALLPATPRTSFPSLLLTKFVASHFG